MSARTGIEWTDATWNPVVGCERVSPGCAHCYAKQLHDQRHRAHLAGKKVAPQYAQPFETVQLKPERLDAPLHWRQPRKVFVNSVADLFHDDVPFEFVRRVFEVMQTATQHTYQVLTKRPARMLEFIREHAPVPAMTGLTWGVDYCPRHIWLGVSVENQRFADERIPLLLATPAAVRFLSCEPLLGPVDLSGSCKPWGPNGASAAMLSRIRWVIVGGESGPHARPMRPEWARTLRDQCVARGIPFFFKQWGGRTPKSGGRELDGRTWDRMPATAGASA